MEPRCSNSHSDPVNSTTLCVENDRLRTDTSSDHTYSFHPEWICNGTKHSWRIFLFASGLGFKTVLIQSSSCTISIMSFRPRHRSWHFLCMQLRAVFNVAGHGRDESTTLRMDEFTKLTCRMVRA